MTSPRLVTTSSSDPAASTTESLVPASSASSVAGAAWWFRVRRAWSGWPGRVVRWCLAVLPFVWLSRQIDASLVVARAVQVGPWGLSLALSMGFASLCIGALRWRVLLLAYGADRSRLPGVLTLLRHNMVGHYFSVLPTGMAGEAVRGYRVARYFPTGAMSYLVLFVERITGLLGLLFIALVAAVFSPSLRAGPVAFAMNAGVSLAFVLGLVVFVLPQLGARVPRVKTCMTRVPVVGALLAQLPAARDVSGLLVAVVLSVLTQLSMVMMAAALITPLSSAATLVACARVVPAIILVTYIPLTPGGLGQREAAFVHFFSLVHVEREAALAASLLFFAVTLALSLLGGLVLLYERARGLS